MKVSLFKFGQMSRICWFILVLCTCFFALKSPVSFESSVFALLPESKVPESQVGDKSRELNEILTERFSSQFVILIEKNKSVSTEQIDAFATSLQSLEGVESLRWRSQDFLDRSLPILPLSNEYREYLHKGDLHKLVDNALGFSQHPVFTHMYDLVQDPLALTLQGLLKAQSSSPFSVEQGRLLVKENGKEIGKEKDKKSGKEALSEEDQKSFFVLMGSLSANPFSLEIQDRIQQTVHQFQQNYIEENVLLLRAGLIFHAAEGAAQGRFEMSTIGSISLTGVLLVLILFLSWRLILPVMVILGIGVCFAFAVTALIFNQIHLISLAFGATLIGVSLDYILHLVVKIQALDLKKSLSKAAIKNAPLQKLIVGLGLSLFSSVVAYLGIALTPFPGLQQMAVFCIFGLTGCWITMWCLYPWLAGSLPQNGPVWRPDGMRLRPVPKWHRQWVYSLYCLSAISFAGLFFLNWQDSVSVFNESDSPLIKEETQVSQLLRMPSLSQYIQISCDELEDCVQQEKNLQPWLQSQIAAGNLRQYEALMQHIPDIGEMRQDKALLDQHYDQLVALFFQQLNLEQLIQPSLAYFNEHHRPDSLEDSIVQTEPYQNFVIPVQDGFVSLIRLYLTPGQSLDISTLETPVSTASDNIRYVNRLDEISATLQQVRIQLKLGIGLAIAFVACVLFLRYGRAAVHILGIPLLSCALVLSALSLISGQVNILHLLAQLLVFGIGLDMGILLRETENESIDKIQNNSTWYAIHLSSITNLMAFGLLAFCQTPALHHFGVGVFSGISLVWLLTYFSNVLFSQSSPPFLNKEANKEANHA